MLNEATNLDRVLARINEIFDHSNQAKPKEGLGLATSWSLDKNVTKFEDELTFTINRDDLLTLSRVLRDDGALKFSQLTDITAVDYPHKEKRFTIVYNLLSVLHEVRIRLNIEINEDETIPSVHEVWPVANWYEREVYDMYGVIFNDHPDLRRILTDYGFEGHPQRKDFPLTGYVELRYDPAQQKCIYEPVKLTQDFRDFDFLSPWEGMTPQRLQNEVKRKDEDKK